MTAQIKERTVAEIAEESNEWARRQGRLGKAWWKIKPYQGSWADMVRENPDSEADARIAKILKRVDEDKRKREEMNMSALEYLKWQIANKLIEDLL